MPLPRKRFRARTIALDSTAEAYLTLLPDRGAVKSLIDLAETLAIPMVSPAGMYMNFPSNHPPHLGYVSEALVQQADVILVIEADVPWFPTMVKLQDTATVIHMGIDPFFSCYLARGYPCDIPLVADSAVAIPLLTHELGQFGAHGARSVSERMQYIKAEHDDQRGATCERLAQVQSEQPIDFEWFSHGIDQVKDDETIIGQ